MRRGRLEIWTDILRAIERETDRPGETRTTRVRSGANVPYTRFQSHMAELVARGLVAPDQMAVTEEGHAFLRSAEQLRAVSDDAGPSDAA